MVYKTDIIAKFDGSGKVESTYFSCPNCDTTLAKIAGIAEITKKTDVIVCSECLKKFQFPYEEKDRYGTGLTIMEVEL